MHAYNYVYMYVHIDSLSPSDAEAADMDSTIDTGKQDSQTGSFKFILLTSACCMHWLPVHVGVLEDIVATLCGKYPQLKINYVPTIGSVWVVIHRPDMALCSPDHPPTYDPHLVFTLADGDVTYDFRALSQSISKGQFSWETIEAHLNSLLPYSGYALCPGIKQYPNAVHFQSKHYVYIVTAYELHQSNGCRSWHVPKNRIHLPSCVV